MENNKAIVVSGFPGVGKSSLFSMPNKFKILDSDSSKFSWLDEKNKVRNPEFPNNYIKHIKDNLQKVDIILVSSHDVVRNAFVKEKILFVLVYPGLEMKDEYIRRYIKRGNNEAFVKLLIQNYDLWISDLKKQIGAKHVPLKSGQYLSDVIDQIVGDIK